MFHVSTMLPYSKGNPQQLERKRHLGNNICNIVFQEDCSTEFFPEEMKSKFNHIFAVVSRDVTKGCYFLKIHSKMTVPDYSPPLPNPAVFFDAKELRHFLLAKLMNGTPFSLHPWYSVVTLFKGSPFSPSCQVRRIPCRRPWPLLR